MTAAEEGVQYPRETVLPEGMPEGWKGIEKMYGSGKYLGKCYTRYYSLDGKHKHVISPVAVIKVDAAEKGYDADEAIKRYYELQKARQDKVAAERAEEREAAGILKGQQREEAIERFRQRHGSLSGPLVFMFEGWSTRWDFMPNSGQVHVTYKDPDGTQWKLLKDLEASFGHKMSQGQDYTDFIEAAKAKQDPAWFGEGSGKARELGTYECSPTGADRDKLAAKAQDGTKRRKVAKASSNEAKPQRVVAHPTDYRDSSALSLVRLPARASDSELAADLGAAHVPDAGKVAARGTWLSERLRQRGFPESTELLAVFGRDGAPDRQHPLVSVLSGFYFQLECSPDAERPCYMKLVEAAASRSNGMACVGIFIYFSRAHGRWKIGAMRDDTAGYAICHDDGLKPMEVKQPWMLLREDFPGISTRAE